MLSMNADTSILSDAHVVERKSHSALGFSSAARWMKCPGSIRLIQKMFHDPAPNDAADEGTAAHHLMELALSSGNPAFLWLDATINVDGKDWLVTQEMADAVDLFCEIVNRHGGELHVEHPVCASSVHSDLWGTADALRITPANGDTPATLRVFDFKYGVGHSVQSVDNPQVLGYAVAAMDTLDLWDKVSLIGGYIVQPRDARNSEAERRSYIGVEALRRWRDEQLRPAVEAVMSPDAPLVTGEHCALFCPVALVCPAARAVVEDALIADPETMPDDELGEWLTKAEAASAVFRAARTETVRRFRDGRQVPGWKMVQGYGDRKWKSDAENALKSALGDAIYTEPTLRSPAQVEKLGPDAKKLVAEQAFRPPGTPKLVPENSKGDAITPMTAKQIFADVKGT